jgi:hypothetical protein
LAGHDQSLDTQAVLNEAWPGEGGLAEQFICNLGCFSWGWPVMVAPHDRSYGTVAVLTWAWPALLAGSGYSWDAMTVLDDTWHALLD